MIYHTIVLWGYITEDQNSFRLILLKMDILKKYFTSYCVFVNTVIELWYFYFAENLAGEVSEIRATYNTYTFDYTMHLQRDASENYITSINFLGLVNVSIFLHKNLPIHRFYKFLYLNILHFSFCECRRSMTLKLRN